MTVMQKKWDKAKQNLTAQTGRVKSKSRAGRMTATDLGADLDDLFKDLTNRQFQGIVDRCNTQVRKAAVGYLKKGSTANRIGRSQYNKRTRGDWQNPKTVGKDYKNAGTNYLEGGWWGEVLDKRGANKESMAYNGGSATGRSDSRGNRGIISKTIPQRSGGRRGIIGPRYGQDSKDDSKYGYNYAHILEKGGAHNNWGKPAKSLPARPFMGPAGESTASKNAEIINKRLKDWGKGK